MSEGVRRQHPKVSHLQLVRKRTAWRLNILYFDWEVYIRGSVNYQINQIFVQSGIFQPGTSKHTDKLSAKKNLPEGQRTPSNISRHTNIHSNSYQHDVKNTWHKLGHFARSEYGLKDMTQLENRHVQGFLEKKLEDCSKYDAWNKIASHVSKLDKALQTNYIRDAVSKVRDIAKSELDRTEPKVKGYNDPQSVISNVSRTDTQLVAKIQLEGGARREEALQFRNDQLKGIQQDPATGEKKGVIELENTKGGKERDIYVSQVTYKQLEERTQNNNFKISPNTYSKHIAQAAKKAGEERTGTHDLRYNWACNRYNECVANGLNNEQALQLTSWEMGHERANMTLHYLR